MERMPPVLSKGAWTDADFEHMSWHDSHVHAYAAYTETYEFALDIDYIVRWEEPDPQQGFFTFWVAPATLVFHHAHAVEVHIGPSHGDMTILELERTDEQRTPNGEMIDWHWRAVGVGGHFLLRATGYTQYFRSPPLHTASQRLSLAQRGGLSFSRHAWTAGEAP